MATCGNNKIEGTEKCDGYALFTQSCLNEGFTGGSLSCKADCTFDTSKCTGTRTNVCGDSTKATTEECDDGNTNANDGCSATCTTDFGYTCTENVAKKSVCVPKPNICGNGLFEPITNQEECDDGNYNNGDGCSSSCKTETGYTCTGATGVKSVCVAPGSCKASTKQAELQAGGSSGIINDLSIYVSSINKDSGLVDFYIANKLYEDAEVGGDSVKYTSLLGQGYLVYISSVTDTHATVKVSTVCDDADKKCLDLGGEICDYPKVCSGTGSKSVESSDATSPGSVCCTGVGAACSTIESNQKCTDSDVTDKIKNGKNYDVQGTTKDKTGSMMDLCSVLKDESKILIEFYCDSSGNRKDERKECEFGCSEGKCLTKSGISGETTEESCVLTSAKWSVTKTKEGELVSLLVQGTNCNDKTVSFKVWEKDYLSEDDPVAIEPPSVVFSGDTVTGIWEAEWQEEGGIGIFDGGDPEYYFTASIVGVKNIKSSDLLHVNQGVSEDDCIGSGGESAHIRRPECSPSWNSYEDDSYQPLKEAFCRAMSEEGEGVVELRGNSYKYFYSKDFIGDAVFLECSEYASRHDIPIVYFDGKNAVLKTDKEKVQVLILSGWHFNNLNFEGPFENGVNKPCGPNTGITCGCFAGYEGCTGESFSYGVNGAMQHNWVIEDSSINGFGGHGILAAGSDNIQIINNRITWNAGAGIALYEDINGYGGSKALVSSNIVEYNGHDGIDFGSTDSQITDNVFSNNGWGEYSGDGSGILACNSGHGSILLRNTVERNRENGIALTCDKEMNNIEVRENTIKSNGVHGIRLAGVFSGVSVNNNVISKNGGGCLSSSNKEGVTYEGNKCNN